jgi:hypothetical protein
MNRNVLTGLCLALALGTAGCQDKSTEPTAPSVAELKQSVKLDRTLRLPLSSRLSDRYFADAVPRAIDPDEHVCSEDPTPVVAWLFDEIDRADQDNLQILFDFAADVIPTAYGIVLQTEDEPQYFGYNGEYTHIMIKTERDIKRFWDIASDDIQLLGMHGTMLQNVDLVAATYEAAFTLDGVNPIPPALARAFAEIVRDAVLADPALNGGNHPIFSFNAFAFSDFNGPIPDKIVMGDGILAGYEALGFGDVAPQGIYAHEFAHHIQYENDYFDDPVPGATTVAELTRYTELMADAMAAYYLTHSRGAAMNQKRVAQFLEVFFQIGDCAFTNDGHHGTPNQRMRAAEFGFQVADEAQKQGHILTSEQFHDLFVDAYAGIVAPDA